MRERFALAGVTRARHLYTAKRTAVLYEEVWTAALAERQNMQADFQWYGPSVDVLFDAATGISAFASQPGSSLWQRF
jgi:hypothetical protein